MNKKKIGRLIIHIDGAARGNPGPAGVGVIVFGNKKEKITFSAYIGETTNNVAEYTALLNALEIPEVKESKVIKIYSDSELLVNQINGFYRVKNRMLQTLYAQAKQVLADFKKVEIEYVPREKNAGADKLANAAIDRYFEGENTEKKLTQKDHKQSKLFE